ncbi:MAG: hypothetical protein IKH18_04130 [Clostridia bacterium]|nr:hypothetical protein [Clostridia bacterium]
MAKNKLKDFNRFELLELIYTLRKENQELTQKCEALSTRVEEIRAEYERHIEEMRMQGAAKDLQIRMKKIEEQLQLLQKLTSLENEIPETGEDSGEKPADSGAAGKDGK